MNCIRKAAEADAVRLAEIEVFNYRLNFYPFFGTDRYFFSEMNVPDVAREYLDEPEKLEHTLVYDDGVVKGFVRINGDEIEKLFVEPAFQGRGIGGELISRAVTERGAGRLLVLEKNLGGIRFYERHGFHLTDRKQEVDDTGKFLVWMER